MFLIQVKGHPHGWDKCWYSSAKAVVSVIKHGKTNHYKKLPRSKQALVLVKSWMDKFEEISRKRAEQELALAEAGLE